MNRYLVTGAAGFIGSHLVEELLNTGNYVIGLDNLSTGNIDNLDFTKNHKNKINFKFIKGDIRSIDTCKEACQDIDFILHQAALGSVPRSIKEPSLYHDNNITGTLNMLIAAKESKVKRFVFASSSSVYGDTPTLPKIETMENHPKSPYAVSKLVGEHYCKLFNELYNLPTVMLRYFNIFGARQNPNSQYAAVIPKFITSFLSNIPPEIHGDGFQTRDFTYIKNVIKANINACTCKKEAYGEPFNIGCGDRISINDLTQTIQRITKSKTNPVYKEKRAGDVKDSLASITKAESLLNLNNIIQLKDGLSETIQWYENEYKLETVPN
ncbi:LPS biosynthesis protein WbpP [Candidatus Marinamargulisbacteria bacterium SCGC AG-414-C22]|nr:LPS biosynthesis protein WbpP [Candidatus Marinamargulisbacteria bacterium SCGC AG-414-C22]